MGTWELLQTTILRTNSKIVGAHTFRNVFLIFLRRIYVTDLYKIEYRKFYSKALFQRKILDTLFSTNQ
ncbi:hypothetical protein LBBP_00473 [Leptospira borgpetersenii serovar Ballum]|uniref:Uncharacterized protein n=1 Tax=Leptospira borgpetersenii serovar Ballum TaxID=280505 RepID=A0A0S2IME7_LEPBO|nr:hypothetical protein LBBP_00473 [Leptospira borgpetersenii serovar Ballum]